MKETTVVKRALKKLSEASMLLTKKDAVKIFESAANYEIVSRRELLDITGAYQDALSRCLSALESKGLVVLDWMGKERYIEISPYGSKLSNVLGNPIPVKVPIASSNVNRILILEALYTEYDGLTHARAYAKLDKLLKKYGFPFILDTNFDFHLRALKNLKQITQRTPYKLTPDGRSTVEIIDNMVGYQIR